MKKTFSMILGLVLAIGATTLVLSADDAKAGDHKQDKGHEEDKGKDQGKDKKEDHGKH